jgi:hypothetical protein
LYENLQMVPQTFSRDPIKLLLLLRHIIYHIIQYIQDILLDNLHGQTISYSKPIKKNL